MLRHYTLSDNGIKHIPVRCGRHNLPGFAPRIGRQYEILDCLGEYQQYRMIGLNMAAAIVIHRNTVNLGEAARQGKHVIQDNKECLLRRLFLPVGMV